MFDKMNYFVTFAPIVTSETVASFITYYRYKCDQLISDG